MTIVWKKSSNTWKEAENFPLPVINIATSSSGDSTELVCINSNLDYKSCIQCSKLGKLLTGNVAIKESFINIGLFYVNPINNNSYFKSMELEYSKLRSTLLLKGRVDYSHLGPSTVTFSLGDIFT